MNEQSIHHYLSSCTLPEWESIPDFGLYMDQLLTYETRCFPEIGAYLDLTSTMVNNYVKTGLIDKPAGKKYSRDSIAQLLMVCLLKQTTPVESMKKLLHPSDGSCTRERYEQFRATQERIISAFSAIRDASPLSYALESASCHLISRLLLAETPVGPEDTRKKK